MKHKIREEKKREECIGLVIIVTILVAILSVSGFFIHSMLSSSSQKQETNSTSELKAAIVDHLSLTAPNQTFIETATSILKQAGFAVDYYSGEKVTVEFYRNLPTHGYGLIILRVHSSAIETQGQEVPVTLFTSELASNTKYIYEQLTGQIVGAAYSPEDIEKGTIYYGINPLFVTQSMKGKFQNTIIIMMGCQGLSNTEMAEAFIQKGARVYVSWNGSVSAYHTDTATTHLLQYLISQKQPLNQAINNTMKEVKPDPTYKSLLIYYPLEAGDYTIQNIIGNITTNTREIIITHIVLEKKKHYQIKKQHNFPINYNLQ